MCLLHDEVKNRLNYVFKNLITAMKIILSLLSKTFFHFTLLRIFMRSVCYIRKKIKYNCCLNEAVRMSQKEEKNGNSNRERVISRFDLVLKTFIYLFYAIKL